MSTLDRFYYGAVTLAALVVATHLSGIYVVSKWTAFLLYILVMTNVVVWLFQRKTASTSRDTHERRPSS